MTSHPPGLESCFPALSTATAVRIEGGWDSTVYLVDDRWIVRIPQRPQTVDAARVELRLLPVLHPELPVDVPMPTESCDVHASVRYPWIPGGAMSAQLVVRHGVRKLARQAAVVLRALHGIDARRAREAGLDDRSGAGWVARYEELTAEFAARVVPLLPAQARSAAAGFLSAVPALIRDREWDAVIHNDLGPDHLICAESGLVGVIDWSDACIGDPAVDYVSLLHDFGPEFAAAVRDAAGLDTATVGRARIYHRLGPWWEVLYGLDVDGRFVSSGIAGVLRRLPGR